MHDSSNLFKDTFSLIEKIKDIKKTSKKNAEELAKKSQELRDIEDSIEAEKERHALRMKEIEEKGAKEIQLMHEESERKLAEFKAKWEPELERIRKQREEFEKKYGLST